MHQYRIPSRAIVGCMSISRESLRVPVCHACRFFPRLNTGGDLILADIRSPGSIQHMKVALQVNDQLREVDADPQTPLLWVLRDYLGMTGTKFGCGIGQCGACTVHLNGSATRSCVIPLAAATDARITTIEGLSRNASHPLQQTWMTDNVPQCGYCQAGMLMAAASLLKENPNPTDAQIDAAITNICRCGTYPRIRAAIHKAAAQLRSAGTPR
jgi:isoquinoline 1-oxidoreductase alpha subunit